MLGVTDGKAVGTYMEHFFQDYLRSKYEMAIGSSALGIDLPSVNTDVKTTSCTQPQSSCPFHSARQKILANPPEQGYLTISNALQWRLQYKRVIGLNNSIGGVVNYVW